MGLKRAYHSKTATGCMYPSYTSSELACTANSRIGRTCRRRKIKCDEARPWCKQCRRSARPCEGYDPPRKTWIFEPHFKQAQKSSGVSEAFLFHRERGDTEKPHPAGTSSQPRKTLPCQAPPSNSILTKTSRILQQSTLASPARPKRPSLVAQGEFYLPHSPSGPYRCQEEQYLFKYYVEVVVSTYYVSRSQLGEPFWSVYLPQVAWHLPGTRYALLSMTKLFQDCARDIFIDMPNPTLHIEAKTFESRAMNCVIQQTSSLESVLMTSITFWVIALCSSDWGRMLQHAYFAQKMISAMSNMKIENPKVLAFCDFLSHACLVYYRTTRGPCALHPCDNLMSCDTSCFTPEDYPLYVRLADALCHLRKARLDIVACRRLLGSRPQLYSQHAELHELLDGSCRKVQFLINRWSDHQCFNLQHTFEEDAKSFIPIPYTKSPFDKVLQDLANGIYKGDSAAVLMKHAEHLLHDGTLSPNLYISVGRDNEKMRRELNLLAFLGSDAQAEPDVPEDLTMLMSTDAIAVEEQRFRASFIAAASGLAQSTSTATYLSDRLCNG